MLEDVANQGWLSSKHSKGVTCNVSLECWIHNIHRVGDILGDCGKQWEMSEIHWALLDHHNPLAS